MTIKKPFDLLAVLSNFSLESKISLNDPTAIPKFLSHVTQEAERALSDSALLYGQRTEAMFESLVVCLGKFKLFKKEDIGLVFPQDKYIVPDYKVILSDGSQQLIEVKNIYDDNPGDKVYTLMTADYHKKMTAYAKATGAELKLAIFWANWGLWTLINPEKFLKDNGKVTVDVAQAVAANEMVVLGDILIGTTPLLRLLLIVDSSSATPIDHDGRTSITISDSKMYCGEEEIVDPVEREIIWIFMLYGGWIESKPKVEVDARKVKSIEYSWEPATRENGNFEIVGSLSQMFTKYYTDLTIQNRKVTQIKAPLRPDWFASLVAKDISNGKLPLWKFLVEPRSD